MGSQLLGILQKVFEPQTYLYKDEEAYHFQVCGPKGLCLWKHTDHVQVKNQFTSLKLHVFSSAAQNLKT